MKSKKAIILYKFLSSDSNMSNSKPIRHNNTKRQWRPRLTNLCSTYSSPRCITSLSVFTLKLARLRSPRHSPNWLLSQLQSTSSSLLNPSNIIKCIICQQLSTASRCWRHNSISNNNSSSSMYLKILAWSPVSC